MKIKKLLVANRGEIAVRIFTTCQELGIRTVAVFSEADRDALHPKIADESIYIGESEPSQSYLSIPKILDAAHACGCQAIHPGYGFLSERHDFAQACQDRGIAFIGPTPETMRKLGDKISAKNLAVAVQVPIVPGFFRPGASLHQLTEAANQVGYPIMLKAAAGGGGRGMRAVFSPSELPMAFDLAKKEAFSSFGNDEMMLEKLILDPRHVEVQILADTHGNISCLFERECSLQRRNQKMLEETPSPAVLSGLLPWDELREAATAMAAAADYSSAGTVEFIVDRETGSFYFMEVNTRLQVEHPVTESCTGLDLVSWQIKVAEGEHLALPQAFLEGKRSGISGHAIEVRVLAEDPSKSFAPSIGKIVRWLLPNRIGVRIDTGFEAGSEISPHYDSLIAKVIAHGQDRDAAIQRLKLALEDFHVIGVRTNIGFLLDLLDHPDFVAGRIDTGFINRFLAQWGPAPIPDSIGFLSEFAMPSVPAKAKADHLTHAWDLQDRFRN